MYTNYSQMDIRKYVLFKDINFPGFYHPNVLNIHCAFKVITDFLCDMYAMHLFYINKI